MFEISWSELLILGLVTLIFVGPKELPRFLGTLGRYMGVVRRQANEFRAVFDQAMREAEVDQIQKEVRAMSDGVKASLDDATREMDSAKASARIEHPTIAKPAAPENKPEPQTAALVAAPAEADPATAPASPPDATTAQAPVKSPEQG